MDRILFSMPKAPREFMYAMAVVQAYIFEYIQEVAMGIRFNNFGFTYRMDEKYARYEQSLKVGIENVSPVYDYFGWDSKQRSEFSCFIDFDFKTARALSLRTNRHIIESLGVMNGCSPRKQPIFPPPNPSQGKGLLIVNWSTLTQAKVLGNMLVGSNHSVIDINSNPLEAEVETCEAVIGPACTLTHMAAAYNKKVLEIFPTIEDYHLYNNEGIKDYQAIVGNVTMDTIMDGWRQLQEEPFYAASFLG